MSLLGDDSYGGDDHPKPGQFGMCCCVGPLQPLDFRLSNVDLVKAPLVQPRQAIVEFPYGSLHLSEPLVRHAVIQGLRSLPPQLPGSHTLPAP